MQQNASHDRARAAFEKVPRSIRRHRAESVARKSLRTGRRPWPLPASDLIASWDSGLRGRTRSRGRAACGNASKAWRPSLGGGQPAGAPAAQPGASRRWFLPPALMSPEAMSPHSSKLFIEQMCLGLATRLQIERQGPRWLDAACARLHCFRARKELPLRLPARAPTSHGDPRRWATASTGAGVGHRFMMRA